MCRPKADRAELHAVRAGSWLSLWRKFHKRQVIVMHQDLLQKAGQYWISAVGVPYISESCEAFVHLSLLLTRSGRYRSYS
jgi:hypothetical protein